MSEPRGPQHSRVPLLDTLGKLITDGKQAADYLWQVPGDEPARAQIVGLLDQIAVLAAQQGRREMPKLAEELKTAARATPSPQQVDILVGGFDRLLQLWGAAKSGMM